MTPRPWPSGDPALPAGREDALRRGREAVQALAEGAGGCLQVVGEPGIGKTRFLGSVRKIARDADIRTVLWRTTRPDADLRELLEHTASGRPDGPVVLLLDDAQRMSPETVASMEELLPRLAGLPVVCVVAHREREAPVRLRHVLAQGVVTGDVVRVELAPLSLEECAEAAGVSPFSPLAAALFEASEGNPLYLTALRAASAGEPDRSLAASSAVSGLSGINALSGINGASRMSGHFQALVLGETLALSRDERSVLQTSSVLGAAFLPEVLAKVQRGLGPRRLQRAVDALTRRDLLRTTPAGRELAFRHPLVGHAVYEGMPPRQRTVVHRRALEVMQAHGASAPELARHIEKVSTKAGAAARAAEAEVLYEAGRACEQTAPRQAAHWFRLAQERLPPSGAYAARRTELSFLRARALALAGVFEESRDLLHDLLPRISGNVPVVRHEAVVTCAYVEQHLGRLREADAMLRAELARLGKGETRARMDIALELGLTATLAADYEAAAEEVGWARTVAHETGERQSEATALAITACCEAVAGRTAAARSAAGAAAAIMDALPDRALTGPRVALCVLGWAELFLERFADAERHLARNRDILERTGHVARMPYVRTGMALVLYSTGRLPEALDQARAAAETARSLGNRRLMRLALALESRTQEWMRPADAHRSPPDPVEFVRGRPAVAEPAGSGLVALVSGCPEPDRRDRSASVEYILRACGPELRLLSASLLAQYAEQLVKTHIALGRLDCARTLALFAVDFAEHLDLAGQRAHAARAYGRVLAATGRHQEALVRFGAAEEGFARAGKRAEQAASAMLRSRSLAELRRSEEALAVAARSAQYASATGAASVAQQAETLRSSLLAGRRSVRAALGTGQSAAAVALAPLTEREREVAELAGGGLTNRRIASRLRLSERTVEAHLANVYRKLGVPNRHALIRLVASPVEHDR